MLAFHSPLTYKPSRIKFWRDKLHSVMPPMLYNNKDLLTILATFCIIQATNTQSRLHYYFWVSVFML